MPCYYTGSALGDAELAASEAENALTLATRAACEMSKKLSAKQRWALSDETKAWIAAHAKVDAKPRRKGI